MTRRWLAALALAGLAAGTVAAERWNLQPERSQVTVTFRQMNVPVEAPFTSFRGDIRFDLRRPERARARIEIDTASFEMGAAEYDEEVRGKAWLDATGHPLAVFESGSVRPLAADRYVARGALSLKGRTTMVEVPFAVRRTADGLVYQGEFPVSRKAHGIGSREWDDVLEDTVVVRFRLVTQTP